MQLNTNLLQPDILEASNLPMKATREAFGEKLLELAAVNEQIVVVNADLEGSLLVDKFKAQFPHRFYQVGVAEQIMAGVGTGLALYGKIPLITSFAAFSPGLNWSQLRLAAMSRANLKVVASHYGLNVGEDGASAQMLEDIALMRVLPHFSVVTPADYTQTLKVMDAVIAHQGPVYLRLTRAKFPVIFRPEAEFRLGEPQLLASGTDLTIVSSGSMVYEALQTAKSLEEQGIQAEVINIHTIKPFNPKLVTTSLAKTGKLVVIEEHQVAGGLGSALLEALADFSNQQQFAYKLLGVNDQFGESGNSQELLVKYGLERTKLAQEIANFAKLR